jgi:hypothetical protein
MKCRSVRSSAKIASGDLLSSIPLLNFSKISDEIAAPFGGSTLNHLEAAKRLSSTLGCQRYHSYHGYLPCGRKEKSIAGSTGKHSSNVLLFFARPRRTGMSGMIDLRLPFDFDHTINTYTKDESREDEAKYGRRNT